FHFKLEVLALGAFGEERRTQEASSVDGASGQVSSFVLTQHSKLLTIYGAVFAGAISITVISGRAQKRTRGAGPPSIPTPRVTYIQVSCTWYKPASNRLSNWEAVINAP